MLVVNAWNTGPAARRSQRGTADTRRSNDRLPLFGNGRVNTTSLAEARSPWRTARKCKLMLENDCMTLGQGRLFESVERAELTTKLDSSCP